MDNSSSGPANTPKPPPIGSFPAPFRAQGAPPGSSVPGGLKLPGKPGPGPGPKPLVLPRRLSPLQRAQEVAKVTTAARKSIGAILQSRPPWTPDQPAPGLNPLQVEELEKNLRALESKVAEQEMALAETQNKLADRERALAEAEALLQARDVVIQALRNDSRPPMSGAPVNSAELAALKTLKEELDRQETSLKEQRAAIKEREEFIEQSEAALFEKMQAQQEKETELEQKSEDVKRAMLRAGLIKPEPPAPMEKA